MRLEIYSILTSDLTKEFEEFFAEKTKEVLKTIEELKKRIS